MADVNTATRKRKLSSEDSIIEIADDDVCLNNSSDSADVEIVEPNPKILHLDAVPSQSSDSNLEIGSLNSQSSVEIITEEPVVDMKQRLLELDDEIRLLRAENADLRTKSCSCKKFPSTSQDTVLTVVFSDTNSLQLHKDSVIQLFELSPDLYLTVDESNLSMQVCKDNTIDPNEWVIIDKDQVDTIPGRSPKKKKKKAKSESPVTNDLFILDTTPSISTKNNLRYKSKFAVLTSSPQEDVKDKQNNLKGGSSCFNCNENHNLRDCPKPKNYSKINAARQKFKPQARSLRYHLDDDQRYSHLEPGKISDNLKRALGLWSNELPEHIYRMRKLGYPPGWFEELQSVNQSELVLFDFQGKGASFSRKKVEQEIDADKVIEYPGFNVPMIKGTKDEHRLYGCPSFSDEVSKASMIEFVRSMHKKVEDNLEACDMDIDVPSTSDKELETNLVTKRLALQNESRNALSPTLRELESQKLKLLEELTDSTSNNSQQFETFQTIDITGTVDEFNDISCEDPNDGTLSPVKKLVKESTFGTPILKSASTFCKLPNAENFSQNVSQVINFENLPNSTGKYEQMIGVLDKVRKTLRCLNEQQV